MNLTARMEAFRAEERQLLWRGTFGEYFEMVLANPRLAQLSHARVYDMLMSAGSEPGPNESKRYNFFADELFGVEKPLE